MAMSSIFQHVVLRTFTCMCACLLFFTPSFAKGPVKPFESAEHLALGDRTALFFSPERALIGQPLSLPNGLMMTYGDILALGDFYGSPDMPISTGTTKHERRRRFLMAFNAFARDPHAITEAKQILDVVYQEKQAAIEHLKQGKDLEKHYRKITDETNRQINCITGGGCSSTWWLKPGRYLKLINHNYDHFGNHAWIAYQTGHRIAIQRALRAHREKDLKQLELAYAMNAFACHFLSDHFASGHIRTPRLAFPDHVVPQVIAPLLAHFMHNEENMHGLHVHNRHGEHWIAYGDHAYFSPKNSVNRAHLQEALQASVDHIFFAFTHGAVPPDDMLRDLLPEPDEQNASSNNDISPLFYWDAGHSTLMRRSNVANIYDRHWTGNWWAWTTLVLLVKKYGLAAEDQAALVLSDNTIQAQALKDKLVTDQDVLDFIGGRNLT